MSRSARGYQANEKLNLAIIGAGGRDSANLSAVASENIVALCDVNQQKAASFFAKHPQAGAHSVFEARTVARVAAEQRVVAVKKWDWLRA